jgi:Na+/H+-dicarboxylate symporter
MKIKLHWQILIALVLAAIVGYSINGIDHESNDFVGGLLAVCEFAGKFFMQALKMIVVPLIVSSIICGVMNLGGDKDFGRMGAKTLIYYSLSGFCAILIGLLLVNIIQPGIVDKELAEQILSQADSSESLKSKFEGRGTGEMYDIFLRMVPPNIIHAATDNGQLLGLIVFSLFFGYFISKLPRHLMEFQQNLWDSVQLVMMKITDFIICLAPIGIFGLVTPIISRTGFEVFKPLSWFVLTVILALLLHIFVVLGGLLWGVGKVNIFQHIRAMTPVLLTAFSTASSASTLPVTMDTVQKNAGVSNRVSSFTLPLGATVNMDGTALYECVVVIFIAQFYSVIGDFSLTFGQQFTVVLMALLTSVGVAGIPSASLVAITVILGVVGLPLEAVGLVWVTDRVLDMCRTAVNVFSDTCGAVIIARTEGEAGVYPANTNE